MGLLGALKAFLPPNICVPACMQNKSKIWTALGAALIPLAATLSPLSKLPLLKAHKLSFQFQNILNSVFFRTRYSFVAPTNLGLVTRNYVGWWACGW
jgi:hypothetical protein